MSRSSITDPSAQVPRVTQQLLRRLRAEAELICKSAHRRRRSIKGAINWADLGPYEVSQVMTDSGKTYFEVWIEEAAPDATELQEYVRKRLETIGWKAVRVMTER